MIIGQSLASGTTAYGPWLDRESDEAQFYLEIIGLMSGVKLDVTLQHKKRTEADSAATTAATFTQITTTGVKDKATSGLNLGEHIKTGQSGSLQKRPVERSWSTVV